MQKARTDWTEGAFLSLIHTKEDQLEVTVVAEYLAGRLTNGQVSRNLVLLAEAMLTQHGRN